jgi:hypothetical protein
MTPPSLVERLLHEGQDYLRARRAKEADTAQHILSAERCADDQWLALLDVVLADIPQDLHSYLDLRRPKEWSRHTHWYAIPLIVPGFRPILAGYERSLTNCWRRCAHDYLAGREWLVVLDATTGRRVHAENLALAFALAHIPAPLLQGGQHGS